MHAAAITAAAMTAEAILAVPDAAPERLFPDPRRIAETYRALVMRWHPDHAGRDDVFTHLAALRRAAEERGPGVLHVAGRRIRYLRAFPFELGRAYFGDTLLTYVTQPEHADLAARAEAAIAALRYDGERMRAEMAPRLPRLRAAFTDEAGCRVLVLEKPPGTVLLADLLRHGGGRIEARHVAWMVSELLNQACYLGAYLRLAHLALGPDTLLVHPARHTVLPLGGWFYATAVGTPLVAVPERTGRLLPASVLASGLAVPGIDLELIRATGREALGDPAGTRLPTDPAVPPALAEWLRTPGGGDPVADYHEWSATLTRSFGERRFAVLPVQATDLYGKEASNG